jgi:ApaG protein
MARPTIMASSHATTQGISITVDARFSPEHSAPSRRHWFFLYTITITNESDLTVQLVSRHWIITDEDGRVEDVRGPGVVGEQPVLMPGERFEYTSGCPLTTPSGRMHGTYQMVTPTGDRFDAVIAPFDLRGPYTVH